MLNKYFYREPYNYQGILRNASQALSVLHFRELLDYLTGMIVQQMKIESASIFLEEEGIFQRQSIERYFDSDDEDKDSELTNIQRLSEEESYVIQELQRRMERGPDIEKFLVREELARQLGDSKAQKISEELSSLKHDVVFPLTFEDQLIGVFFVGAKLSGDPYFQPDLDLLSTVSNQAAIAIRNAQLYTEVNWMRKYNENILYEMESGVITVDNNGVITMFNDAAEKLLGVDKEETIGKEVEVLGSKLVLSPQEHIINRTKELFGSECNFFSANSSEDAIEIINSISPDVVIVDSEDAIHKAFRTVKTIKKLSPNSLAIGLVNSEELKWIDEEELAIFDFISQKPLKSPKLRSIVQKAFEANKTRQEARILKDKMTQLSGDNMSAELKTESPSPQYAHILTRFAKTMSASFDIDKMTELFLDTVEEMVSPSRMLLLLYDKHSNLYKTRAYRGFSPKFVANFKLPADNSLPRWLVSEHRVIRKAEAEEKLYESTFFEIKDTLDSLKSTVSIPLSAQGKLIGILSLGKQVTGMPYSNEKLELLFTLASQIAVAIQDISLHHQLEYQKNQIENILTGMSSGVITIDETEKIVICNQRALDILEKDAHELQNRDLRNLPSPLGDMLFETLSTGKNYEKEEVTILPEKLPLEITTCRIRDGKEMPIGSAIIFDDISSRKQLIEQKQRSEQLDLINRMTKRIAHETKNPLVSIQTFLDMFEERFDEQEFREKFGGIAKSDLNRLNELVEKLISFIQQREYKFELVEINPLIEECVNSIKEESDDIKITTNLSDKLSPIKADKEHLKQAFGYLLKYLAKTVQSDGTLSIKSYLRKRSKEGIIRIIMTGENAQFSEEEIGKLFNTLAVAKNSSIDMGPSASDKIIQEHKGKIEVKTRKGNELRFKIDIPVDE